MPHQHRNVDRLARFEHGVIAVGAIDERELLVEAHVLEIQPGERRPRVRSVEGAQVDRRRRLEQYDSFASVDLMQQHLPLIAVEMQVPDISGVRHEDRGHQVEVAVLLRQREDFGRLGARNPAGRRQLKRRQDARWCVVYSVQQSRVAGFDRTNATCIPKRHEIGCGGSAAPSALVYSS